MSYSLFDFFTSIGALGLFLYGMKLMSEGLQKVAGNSLRSILSIMTKNRFVGLLTGVLITALIQSSSAATVMVVSFVNAGLLTLIQAISVIMGANIGTTITAWIISLFGFKVSIASLSLPMMAVAIPFIFSTHNKRKSFGEFLMGFALLFMGLDLLKNSVPDLGSNPELFAGLQSLTGYGYGSVFIFLAIGTVLTVIVQSSSATMAITLIMCSQGWISFELAAAMVMGENIGTTITANIAAIPANVQAKRAALAHLAFNIFGVIWLLILFYPFTQMIGKVLEFTGASDPHALKGIIDSMDPQTLALINDSEAVLNPAQAAIKESYLAASTATTFALAIFHTMFNLINSFVMIWLVAFIAKTVTFLIPQKKDADDDFRLTYITSGMLSTSELSILQADKEILAYSKRITKMYTIARSAYEEKNPHKFDEITQRVQKYEDIADRMEIEIANYLTRVAEGGLGVKSKKNVHAMIRVISEIESIGDSCNNLAKVVGRAKTENLEYTPKMKENLDAMFDLVQLALTEMSRVLDATVIDQKVADISTSLKLEDQINDLLKTLKMENASIVKEGGYTYPLSVVYMDAVSECEKIGDYIINVVEQYQETAK